MNFLPPQLQPLAQYKQFILWEKEHKGGRVNKYPVHYSGLHRCDAHDPENWLSAKDAFQWAKMQGCQYGVGFVFTENDPFFFVDIDYCREDIYAPWSNLACEIMGTLGLAAIEVSQSGRGLHIFGVGNIAEHGNKNIRENIELYTKKRFVALTGNCLESGGSASADCSEGIRQVAEKYFPVTTHYHTEEAIGFDDAPCPEWRGPIDDAELIKVMLDARPSAKEAFGSRVSNRDLWEANATALANAYPSCSQDKPFDSSSADLALCSILAYFTGKNMARIDRLFRQSNLYRKKWERPDYREGTIRKAASSCKAVYGINRQIVKGLDGKTILDQHDQEEFFKNFVYVVDRHAILDFHKGVFFNPDRFNAFYAGKVFSMGENSRPTKKPWDAFTGSQGIQYPKVDSTCFRPDLAAGVVIEDKGISRVNIFMPRFGRREVGDVSFFLQHIEKLIPNESDREILLSYLAALVQKPGEKFQWAVLLQGCEGNGKSIIYDILSYTLGAPYVHLPNPADLMNKFNAWIENKLLICIEEIRIAGRQDQADALKPLLTNKHIEVQAKGADQRTGENRANFLMFSNHKDAVLKTTGDRRYCVMFSAQQDRSDLDKFGMNDSYFYKLFDWLERGGYANVAEYLHTRPVTINVKGRAPMTTSTQEALTVSLGHAEQLIYESIDNHEMGFNDNMVSSRAVNSMLRRNGLALSPKRISESLTHLGYYKHPALAASDGKYRRNGENFRLYVKRGSPQEKISDVGVLSQAWENSASTAVMMPHPVPFSPAPTDRE